VFIGLIGPGAVYGAELLPTLTSVAAVRSLTVEGSQKGYPVRIRGTVTIDIQKAWLFFIQEDGNGIALARDSAIPSHFRLGDQVEVTGATAPGGYSPLVVIEKITLLGHGPLPRPARISIRDLRAAGSEGRWVEVSGKIESVQAGVLHESALMGTDILLDVEGQRLRVVVAGDLGVADPESLIDAGVQLLGVVSTTFNQKGQLTGVMLNVPGVEQMSIVHRPPSDPWGISEQEIPQLLQFRPGGVSGSRVRVRGQVTFFDPGQQLVIQHSGNGLIAMTAQRDELHLGDFVEVLGRPVSGGYTPILQEAIYRKIRAGNPLAPAKHTAEQLLNGDFDAELVSTEAELLNVQRSAASTVLSLRAGQIQFTARLEATGADAGSGRWEIGSKLLLTGICRVLVNRRDATPQSFDLQLRSPADIEVLVRPSWWTLTKLGMALSGMAIAITLVFGWGWSLRVRVKRQTAALTASEREFRDLFENSPNGIYRAAPDGQILLANPTMVWMLGYETLEEFKEVRANVRCDLDGRCSIWNHFNGTEIQMRERSHEVFDFSGTLLYSEGTVEDITGQRLAEQRDRERKHIFEMMARDEPLADILTRVALAVEAQRPRSVCCIMLRSERGLSVGAAPNLPGVLLNDLNGIEAGPVNGCCGSAAHWNQAVTSSETSTDVLWDSMRDSMRSSGLRACCSVPVRNGTGEVEGTLALYWPHPHQATEAEIKMLQAAGNVVMIAIKHHDLYAELAWRGEHDALTGLANRRLFEKRLESALVQARTTDTRMALLWIDLDCFKQINDTYGHQTGDEFLRQVAQRLENGVRCSDTVARIGGDEFAAVLATISGNGDARKIAERLEESIRQRFRVGSADIFGGASIGVSIFPDDGSGCEELQRNADAALYRAKNLGKRRIEFFTKETVDEESDLVGLMARD